MINKITFNKEQQKAVDFKNGALGVVAGAGSGKSSLLLGRVDKLITEHKVFQGDILCISFTKNTADDLTNELSKMGHYHVNVGTFHAICGQILRQEGVNINNMVQEWQIENCFKAINPLVDVKDVMNFISYQRSYMRGVDDEFVEKDSLYDHDDLRKYYKSYESLKKKLRAYDFDDYLLLCLEVLKKNPGKYTYEYILVDEHQDSNLAQNMLLQEWCQSGNIFAAFDFRQALYSFRAGNVEYSMNFKKYWKDAQTINVHTNYRSPKNIVEKANHFIKQYYGNYEHYTDATSNNQEDGHIEINSYPDQILEGKETVDRIERLISNGTPLNEIAVIYRANSHADYVESELKRRDIDYEIASNGSFFKRREIAGILSVLRLVMDTEDNSAFEGAFRLRTYPLMYFSNAILYDIQKYARDNGGSLYDSIMRVKYPKAWYRSNAQIFQKNIEKLQDMYNNGSAVELLIDETVKLFRIKKLISEKYSNEDERKEREGSIKVLKNIVQDNNLEDFITYVYTNDNIGKKKEKKNAVKLMSVHRSKGLEWDNVFVIGIEDDKFPDVKSNIDEEARVMYVAVTRSKKNLFISEIGKGNRFIREYGEV